MATAYLSDSYNIPITEQSFAGIFPVFFRMTIPAAGFALNDTVALCSIPGGATAVGYEIWSDQIDSNGAPTLTIDLGDSGAGNSQVFIAAQAVGRSSTYNYMSHGLILNTQTVLSPVNRGCPRHYVQAAPGSLLNFLMTIHAAPATATTSGKITGYLMMAKDGYVPLV